MTEIEELRAEIAALRADIGDYTKPALEGANNIDRPNGDATVVKSLKQLHQFADGLVGTPGVPDSVGRVGRVEQQANKLEQTVVSLEAALATLQNQAPSQAPPQPSGSLPPGARVEDGVMYIDGDVVFTGRAGFGGLDSRSRSKVQLVGNSPSIHFKNANGEVAATGLSEDGGIRTQQNGYFSVDEFDAYDPAANISYKSFNVKHANPARAWVNVGPDSRGDFSLTKDTPGSTHEYTQDMVIQIDEATKEFRLALYRPGWKWALAVDARYGPETFWTPELYTSRG